MYCEPSSHPILSSLKLHAKNFTSIIEGRAREKNGTKDVDSISSDISTHEYLQRPKSSRHSLPFAEKDDSSKYVSGRIESQQLYRNQQNVRDSFFSLVRMSSSPLSTISCSTSKPSQVPSCNVAFSSSSFKRTMSKPELKVMVCFFLLLFTIYKSLLVS
jgi:hypothetical protein